MHRNKECQWWIDRCPATEINIEAIKFVFGWIFMFRAVLLCFTLMPMPLLIYIHIFIYFVPDALPIVSFFLCLVSCLVSSCVLSFFFIWNKKVKKKTSKFNVTKCEWKIEEPVNFTTHAFTYPNESENFCPTHFFLSFVDRNGHRFFTPSLK